MNRGGTSHFSRPAMGQSRLSPVYFVPGLFPGLFPRFISGLFRDKASRIVGTFRDRGSGAVSIDGSGVPRSITSFPFSWRTARNSS